MKKSLRMEKMVLSVILPIVVSLITYGVTKFFDNRSKEAEEIRVITSKKDEEVREVKRKRYEEYITTIESILARKKGLTQEEYLKELNLVYAKMFITAPDAVVKIIKQVTNDPYFDANSRKKIYIEIRKDMIGETNVVEDDLCYFGNIEDKNK